jgi:hypothetical protein
MLNGAGDELGDELGVELDPQAESSAAVHRAAIATDRVRFEFMTEPPDANIVR